MSDPTSDDASRLVAVAERHVVPLEASRSRANDSATKCASDSSDIVQHMLS